MRSLPLGTATCLFAALLPSGFPAAGELRPLGEWRTANGLAYIRIDECDGVLWGTVSWEKEPGGLNLNSPDPGERNQPTLGLHILRAMRPAGPGQWRGEVYNPENGKTYDSKINFAAPDVLRIEGCLLGFLCGGESWTRVKPDASAAHPRRKEAPAATVSACSGLPGGAGAAHKGGLK